MTHIEAFVERVLASGVLSPSLVELPPPATLQDCEATESRLASRLPSALYALLGRWNGANLDVVRLVPCESLQIEKQGLYFANDPSGFMYFFDSEGCVAALDTDSGDEKIVATGIEDFLTNYVFGSRSSDFMGVDWQNAMHAAGFAN